MGQDLVKADLEPGSLCLRSGAALAPKEEHRMGPRLSLGPLGHPCWKQALFRLVVPLPLDLVGSNPPQPSDY